jgi:hypothetical protein
VSVDPDPLRATRWTYDMSTVERVRRIADRTGEELLALLAVLRAYAWHGDHDTGENVYPGRRLLCDELAIAPKRLQRLRDALIAGNLLIDTGHRRGKGGTPVDRLALPTGSPQARTTSTEEPTGSPQAGTTSPPNRFPTGSQLVPPRPEPDKGPETTQDVREGAVAQVAHAREAAQGNCTPALTHQDREDLLAQTYLALEETWELCGQPGPRPTRRDVLRITHGTDARTAYGIADQLARKARDGDTDIKDVIAVCNHRLRQAQEHTHA